MPIPAGSADTTTTLSEWVAEVRYHLDAHTHDLINTLASAYTTGSGSLVFTYALGNIGAGSVLSLGENTFYVLAVDTGTKTATVTAGWEASTDANADAGSVVRVNPRFTDHRIVKALNHGLSMLSSPDNGLYAVTTTDLAYTDGVEGYNLDVANFLKVLQVRRETADSALDWPKVRSSDWDVLEEASTDDFAAGRALRVRTAEPGYSVQVVCATLFTALSGLSTQVYTSGIPSSAEDIPPLAAAIYLMSGREVRRNTMSSQGDTRRAEEVPQGAIGRSYGGLVGLMQRRIREEASRLRAQWPVSK